MNTDQIEYILDHYKNPRNCGTLQEPDIRYEEGQLYNFLTTDISLNFIFAKNTKEVPRT